MPALRDLVDDLDRAHVLRLPQDLKRGLSIDPFFNQDKTMTRQLRTFLVRVVRYLARPSGAPWPDISPLYPL